MLAWQEIYRQKTVTAQQAANMIHDGDRIMTGARDCRAVFDRLMERSDVKDVFYYAPIYNYIRESKDIKNNMRFAASFLSASSAELYAAGRLEFIPGEYWQFEKIVRDGFGCKIAFVCVSKPDEHGFMSTGTSNDYIRRALKSADLVIAETNSEFPFIHGNNVIHVSEVDYIVDEGANYPLPSSPIDTDPGSTEIYKAIGGYLSELIPNEATIEVGIGRLNSAALMYLDNKHDLGVHTEIFGDILMKLTERGIITNACKSMNRGKSIFTQMSGTTELFRWSDHNMGLEINSCQDVLNPGTIQQQYRMTAINNAVEIDLLGQGNAEYLKGRQYSGMGGIGNFACGAASCVDGKSIIVLESVTKNGKFSKIVPVFKPGTPVSLPRTAIEYVVTEYGVATLVGKCASDRARELIAVAHPKFREELTFQAKEIGIL